jgi:hypothetical protein
MDILVIAYLNYINTTKNEADEIPIFISSNDVVTKRIDSTLACDRPIPARIPKGESEKNKYLVPHREQDLGLSVLPIRMIHSGIFLDRFTLQWILAISAK